MRIGPMDRKLSLRHRVNGSQDANGSYASTTYTEYAEVWGAKEEINGREFFAAAQKEAERTVRFVIRHRTDVLNTDRITSDDIDYDIVHVAEIGRREGLRLFVRAMVS